MVDGKPSADAVRRIARYDFQVEMAELEPIVGGLDREASVWLGRDLGGREWAVKWTRRDNRFGLLLARSLNRAGSGGVPEQLVTRGDLPWSVRRGGRLSISSWVTGREAFETGLSASEWGALGSLLRRVHGQEPPAVPSGDDIASRHGARHGIRRAGTRIRHRLQEIDRLAAERAQGPVEDASVLRVMTAWPDIRTRIDALDQAARRLKETRALAMRVSCHGDPHLGNVIVDDAGQPWLIDFDDAVRAPREVDLMLVELGVLFARPIGDADREAFRAGYGPLALDHDRVLRFGCVRAVEDLLEAVHDLFARRPTRPSADLEGLIDGILSPYGLAGLVEQGLARI